MSRRCPAGVPPVSRRCPAGNTGWNSRCCTSICVVGSTEEKNKAIMQKHKEILIFRWEYDDCGTTKKKTQRNGRNEHKIGRWLHNFISHDHCSSPHIFQRIKLERLSQNGCGGPRGSPTMPVLDLACSFLLKYKAFRFGPGTSRVGIRISRPTDKSEPRRNQWLRFTTV